MIGLKRCKVFGLFLAGLLLSSLLYGCSPGNLFSQTEEKSSSAQKASSAAAEESKTSSADPSQESKAASSSVASEKENGESTVKVFFNQIKIYIDGALLVSKSENGKILEPFTMDGEVYVPLSAVAGAFGKDFIWDGATQSAYVGKQSQNQPDNYLDDIQYSDYLSGYEHNKFYKINGSVTDYLKTDYTSGILLYFTNYAYVIKDDPDEASMIIDYPLNATYKTLSGKIVLPKTVDIAGLEKKEGILNEKAVNVLFYADGNLLYTATNVTNTMPFSFDLDLTGVNKLTIKIAGNPLSSYVALTDLALYK